jgi:hypothetical protein
MTTTTQTTEVRYYVARELWTADKTRAVVTVQRLASPAAAKQHANALHANGALGFPTVIAAANREAAIDKATRCYRREITCAQARSPKVR